MPTNIYLRELPCVRCGSNVMTNARVVVCDDCKEQDAKPKFYGKKKSLGGATYVLVSDPDKEFGYIPGKIFSGSEVTHMLEAINHAFTPGTILQGREGLVRIDQDPTGKEIKVLL